MNRKQSTDLPLTKVRAGFYVTKDGRHCIEKSNNGALQWSSGTFVETDDGGRCHNWRDGAPGWSESDYTLHEATNTLRHVLARQQDALKVAHELHPEVGDLIACRSYFGGSVRFATVAETGILDFFGALAVRADNVTQPISLHTVEAVREQAEALRAAQADADAAEAREEADAAARKLLGPSADADVLQHITSCFAIEDRAQAMSALLDYAINQTRQS
jgi:hypothetical protein